MNKKTIAILSICIGIISVSEPCFAGSINGNEAAVISAASGTFEYDGATYKAKPEYLSQLSAKLSQDGVDLSASQSQEAISTIYSNVATGVAQGYLYQVGGSSRSDTEEDSSKSSTKNTESSKKSDNDSQVVSDDQSGGYKVVSGDKVVLKYDDPIKNTGYSFTGILRAGIGLAAVALLSIILQIKSYFAQKSHDS